MLHMVPCCKLNIVSVASFPCTPRPALCHLPFCKQQEVRRQSEKDSTQSTLWILSPRKLHTHTKYKSIPAGATYWAYKFSCKYGLFMPSHPPHCTKHKYYTQYRQRGCLQIVSRQKSSPFSRNNNGRHHQVNHRRLLGNLHLALYANMAIGLTHENTTSLGSNS